MTTAAAADQLRDELGAQAASWGALLGTDVLQELTRRVDERADRIVAALEAGGYVVREPDPSDRRAARPLRL